MQCYLREYRRLKAFPVVQAGGAAGVVAGALFDRRDWRIRGLLIDAGGRRFVDVAAVERIVDQPPQLRLKPGTRPLAVNALNASTVAQQLDTDGLLSCSVVSRDGLAGRLADVLVNVDSWLLRFFVVHSENGLVLLDVTWTTDVDLPEHRIAVDVPAGALRSAPGYQGLQTLTPGYEDIVSRHYTQRDFHT